MSWPVIYHGTPMTPRAALRSAGAGRAMCVSFWRPDDAEVVEAISPAIMFRQRCVFRMDGCPEARRALVHPRRLDAVLQMAGSTAIRAGSMGGNPRCARCAVSAQRQPFVTVAVRRSRRAAVAHGWTDRTVAAPVRSILAGVPWLDRDRRGQGRGLRGLVPAHGRDRAISRQPMASAAPHARRTGSARVPVRQRGCEQRRAEWVAI
jgi:hypothetical protein